MTTETRPVAKALHTITVLVQVAKHVMRTEGKTAKPAMQAAMTILGLNDRPDPHELAATALKQLPTATRKGK